MLPRPFQRHGSRSAALVTPPEILGDRDSLELEPFQLQPDSADLLPDRLGLSGLDVVRPHPDQAQLELFEVVREVVGKHDPG